MKIIVYGAGVMAQYVKESVINSGNEFVGLVDPLGNGDFENLKGKDVDFDAIIDFSHFSLLEDVLEAGIDKKVPVLIATTGHSEEQLAKIQEASKQIPIIKATNTSVGVNIVNEIVAFATKLLKDFENEVETYQKRIYFLYQIQDSYLEWNTLSTDVNANFNQLIYLINLNKEDLHRQYISPYDIDPKYLKTDKSKIIINKDEKVMKDYTELEKKVGIV